MPEATSSKRKRDATEEADNTSRPPMMHNTENNQDLFSRIRTVRQMSRQSQENFEDVALDLWKENLNLQSKFDEFEKRVSKVQSQVSILQQTNKRLKGEYVMAVYQRDEERELRRQRDQDYERDLKIERELAIERELELEGELELEKKKNEDLTKRLGKLTVFVELCELDQFIKDEKEHEGTEASG